MEYIKVEWNIHMHPVIPMIQCCANRQDKCPMEILLYSALVLNSRATKYAGKLLPTEDDFFKKVNPLKMGTTIRFNIIFSSKEKMEEFITVID